MNHDVCAFHSNISAASCVIVSVLPLFHIVAPVNETVETPNGHVTKPVRRIFRTLSVRLVIKFAAHNLYGHTDLLGFPSKLISLAFHRFFTPC